MAGALCIVTRWEWGNACEVHTGRSLGFFSSVTMERRVFVYEPWAAVTGSCQRVAGRERLGSTTAAVILLRQQSQGPVPNQMKLEVGQLILSPWK